MLNTKLQCLWCLNIFDVTINFIFKLQCGSSDDRLINDEEDVKEFKKLLENVITL